MILYIKMATVHEKAMSFGTTVIKSNVATELSMEKICLQIMLSDNGYSNFKRVVALSTERSQKTEHFAEKCSLYLGSIFFTPLKMNVSLQLGILQTTVWRVFHNHFHLKAYKTQIVQALKPDDKSCLFHFVKDITSDIEADENYYQTGTSVIMQQFTYKGR
jgi:hypothetical protein